MSRAETHKPRGVDLSGGKCLGELIGDYAGRRRVLQNAGS